MTISCKDYLNELWPFSTVVGTHTPVLDSNLSSSAPVGNYKGLPRGGDKILLFVSCIFSENLHKKISLHCKNTPRKTVYVIQGELSKLKTEGTRNESSI